MSLIANKIAANEPLDEDQLKVSEALCLAVGMEVSVVTLRFDIYTNSMGGGSQTFTILHDSEDVQRKVLAHLYEHGLPTLIPRRFDTNKFLSTKIPRMISRGEIQYEDGPRNGNGGMIFSAKYVIDTSDDRIRVLEEKLRKTEDELEWNTERYEHYRGQTISHCIEIDRLKKKVREMEDGSTPSKKRKCGV